MNEDMELKSSNVNIQKKLRPMPSGAVLMGQEENDYLKVYFDFGSYIRLIRHAKAGSIIESEGFLIGGSTQAGDIVVEAISEANLEMSGEAIKVVFEEMNMVYPFMELIGRYVCRPGSNGEATEADVLYQKSFFPEIEQILFVYDTINNNGAFYILQSDTLKRLGGFYLFARSGKVDFSLCESVLQGARGEQDNRLAGVRGITNKVYALSIATFISIAVLLVSNIYLYLRQAELEKKFLTNNSAVLAVATSMPTLEAKTPETTAVQSTSTPETAMATPVTTPTQVLETTGSYTVSKGDTLERISIKYYGNISKAEAIAKANGFDRGTAIKVGQKLKMPEN